MISDQFITFIKQQLAVGVAKEDITRVLKINGLSDQEIAEGFTAVGDVSSASSAAVSMPKSIATVGQAVPGKAASAIWSKGIPRINWVFMVVSLLLVFGLDFAILIASPSLA